MEKTYKLFKKNLPIMITLSVIGLIFGLFTLLYYYEPKPPSIDFKNVIPIFTAIFLVASVVFAIAFTAKIKKLHVVKLKRSSGFSKFAALFAASLISALFLYEFIKFVITPSTLPTFKIIRLIVSVPAIAYLIVGLIPKKIKRKRIEIPTWVRPTTSVCMLAWCILGLLAVYFWNGLPTTNIFKLLHMAYYVLATLFIVAEIDFEFFSKNHRFYIITSALLFIWTFVAIGPIMFAKFFGKIPGVTISEFEIFAAVALGTYALSKLIAMQQTLQYVMKKESSDSRHHSHHHHHHTSKKVGKATSKSAIPEDIDI